MKRFVSVLLAVAMIACTCAFSLAEGTYTPGTYTGSATGMGPMTVEVEFSADAILSVTVTSNAETYGIGTGMPTSPVDTFPAWIVENQSLACDTVSGATISSNAVVNAVADAVTQAGGDAEALKAKVVEAAPAADETVECDVVVAGAGIAGLSAALAAQEAGANVILLEKMGVPGGSSTRCGGYFLAGGSRFQQEQGIEDNAEAFYAYLMEFAGETGDAEKIKAFADNSAATIEWLADNGATFAAVVSVDSTESPAREHSTMGNAAMASGLGGPMTVPATNTFVNNGGTLLCDTTATELVLDADGAVAGIKATRKDGSTLTVNAKSVVLATGGYAGDYARTSVLEGSPLGGSATAGDTGDAEKIVAAVNGQVVDSTRGNVTIQSFTTGVGCGEESGLIVNPSGARFINEYTYFYRYTEKLIDDGYSYGYYIADADDPNMLVQYGMTLSSTPHAASAKELAELIGVDPDTFEQTIARYNELCDAGEDADFGKPAEYMNKLEGELYAIRLDPSISGTYGGVMTNVESEVLDNDGNVIPHLYAAGEAAFCGLIGENGYPMCGYAIGTACYFGKTAGTNAAK